MAGSVASEDGSRAPTSGLQARNKPAMQASSPCSKAKQFTDAGLDFSGMACAALSVLEAKADEHDRHNARPNQT